MDSIGERLRQERLRRGFNLQQIAEFTKISAVFLEAIEADDLERLPGIFFTRSFVRQYARALGLEEAEFEPELNRLAACERVPTIEGPPASPQEFDVPPVAAAGRRSSPRRLLGSLAVLLLIVTACSAIYVLWQRTHESKPAASSQPVSVPAPPPAPAQPVTTANADQPAAAPSSQPDSSAPTPSSEPAPAQPPAAEPAVEASAPQTSPPAQPEGAQPGPVQVRIHATEATWVRLAVDGKYLFSGILQPDQTRDVEANQLVQLLAGNAGGLEVSWNGKPVGPIGPRGQVRNVEFKPDGFKVLAVPARAPDSPGVEP
ncbi:MAG: RodZ domain-containing protein [Bryobacteraceae bacterium]|jgi:cytoskeleton protein RodZ